MKKKKKEGRKILSWYGLWWWTMEREFEEYWFCSRNENERSGEWKRNEGRKGKYIRKWIEWVFKIGMMLKFTYIRLGGFFRISGKLYHLALFWWYDVCVLCVVCVEMFYQRKKEETSDEFVWNERSVKGSARTGRIGKCVRLTTELFVRVLLLLYIATFYTLVGWSVVFLHLPSFILIFRCRINGLHFVLLVVRIRISKRWRRWKIVDWDSMREGQKK